MPSRGKVYTREICAMIYELIVARMIGVSIGLNYKLFKKFYENLTVNHVSKQIERFCFI